MRVKKDYLRATFFLLFNAIHADYIIDSRAHACDSALSLRAARRRALGSRLGAPAVKNCDYIR